LDHKFSPFTKLYKIYPNYLQVKNYLGIFKT
jgi:hypothetical protein